VADKAAIGVFVGFFADHDFIDQARRRDMRWRYPRQLHTGEVALDALEQGHEVPYGKHMKFHQCAYIFNGANIGEKRVAE